VTATPLSFTCNATPTEDPVNLAYYFVDDSTVIRYNIGAAADVTSPPIPK